MVAPVGREAYRSQILALMPRGRAWPHHVGSVLARYVDALAARFADIDARAVALLDELLASRTVDLLPEWEADVGLPDDCSELASTLQARRASVVLVLTGQPDMSPESFREIGRRFGADLNVHQLDQARADAIPGLDTTNGRWRYVWWIEIPRTADDRFFSVLSHVNTPLKTTLRNLELECRLLAASPAHTALQISYV